MTIERNKEHPEITIITTPQGPISYNFNLGKGVETNGGGVIQSFTPEERVNVEKALDAALNPINAPAKVQELQGKLNSTIITTQRGYPLAVGTSPIYTAESSGGAALPTSKATDEAVLVLNLEEIARTPYAAGVKPPPMTRVEDQIRHEHFHYVDPYLSESNKVDIPTKEGRAIWATNQIMLADNQLPRVSHTWVAGQTTAGFYESRDQRMTGVNIPDKGKGFGEPSPDDHRMYPHNMQKVTDPGYNIGQTVPDKDATIRYEAEIQARKDFRAAHGLSQDTRNPDAEAASKFVADEMMANAIRAKYQAEHPNVAQNGNAELPKPQAPEPDFSRHQ